MKAKRFVLFFTAAFLLALVLIGSVTYTLDPFFHYRAPDGRYYYTLSEKRYQNDGITRHFEYDAVITGSSMCENFLTSSFDRRFGTHSVKLPYPGATFREVNDNLKLAFSTHDIRVVLRPLDYSHLVEDKDLLRTDMGDYPTYLTNGPGPDDVQYLINGTVLSGYCLPMLAGRLAGRPGGIDSFDDYGFSKNENFSAAAVLGDETGFGEAGEEKPLTEEEKKLLLDNIEANVVSLAREHPECTFYYYFTPYSAAWMGFMRREGTLHRQIEAEELAARAMLGLPNLHLFSFSLETEIVADLGNYRDPGHYSPAVSEWILDRIEAGENELTEENLDAYLSAERALYENYPYDDLFLQLGL